MHMQNLIKFYQVVHKILSGNKILILTKGHSSVVNLQKWTRNNHNLALVKVNAYEKLDQIPLSRNEILMLTKSHNCCKFAKMNT